MSVELKYLTFITALTALMWMPYILNLITVQGLINAVGYGDNQAPLAPWANRMKAAHYNAVENLVVFAVLVLIAHVAGIRNEVTEFSCVTYFWARVVHFAAYTFAIPWVRTLSFFVAFGCQVALAWQILA